jgi:hypothetical protein
MLLLKSPSVLALRRSAAAHVSGPEFVSHDPPMEDFDYSTGREPVMRMSTSLLALCCQPGPEAI